MTKRKEKRLVRRPLPVSDPIYTRGFVIGRVGRPLTPPTKEKAHDETKR